MQFIPEEKKAVAVPYFEDVKEGDGWQGHGTHKEAEELQSEVIKAVTRLGGIVSAFQRGTFQIEKQKRQGLQVHYAVKGSDGRLIPGRLDVAALPLRNETSRKRDAAYCMALYMLREFLDGMWLMQQLSPGYAPLMPWMLASPDGKTVSQLWAESSVMNNLLPPGDADFIEAEVV